MNQSRLVPDAVGAVAGVVFAVLLLLALASLDPLSGATDAELIAWWQDGGNVRDTYVSTYILLSSVPFFLLFLSVLRGRLASVEDAGAPLASLVFALGICFAAAVVAGSVFRGVVAHSVRFDDEALPGADTLRYLTAAWTMLFGMVAIPAAALMVGVASWGVLRTGVMHAWLAIAGFVVLVGTAVAVALGAGPWAAPLLQLWVIAGSVELWRTRGGQPIAMQDAPAVARTSDALSR
jgi:hypothetical protein